jgi:hypothetical protein
MEPLAGMLFGVVARPVALGMIATRPDCSRSYRQKSGKQRTGMLLAPCPHRQNY